MNREEFIETLNKNGIDSNIVSFDDGFAEGHCVRKNYFRWEVFIRERGQEYDVIGFPSESDALTYLLEEILRFYRKIKNN